LDNRKFWSILIPCASSGSISFTLASLNANSNSFFINNNFPYQPSDNFFGFQNVTITGVITGLNPTMNEEQIALTIFNQASSILGNAGVLYTGTPVPIPDPPAPQWRLVQTGHVVNIWSQCQFTLNVTADTTGSYYSIDDTPTLVTVADALKFGPVTNQQFLSNTGGPLTNTQIADLMTATSGYVTAILKNPVVQASYYYESWTNFVNGIQLQNYPIQYSDNPFILRPTIITNLTLSATADLFSRYFMDSETGWIQFRFAQDLLFNFEPFDMNNQFRLSYIAGYLQIPRAVKLAIIAMSYQLQTQSNVEELRGGSFVVKFQPSSDRAVRSIFEPLRKYMRKEDN
jgi:hypothetical protein